MSNDLKSALTKYTGNAEVQVTNGYCIYTNDSIYNKSSLVENSDYCFAVIPCTAGDKFTITGTGGYSPRLWTFGDGTNVLSNSGNAESVSNKVITAPSGATELIYNARINSTHSCYIGGILVDQVDLLFSQNNVPIIHNIVIKTKNVFESFTANSYAFNFNSSSNIHNYTDFATASSYAKNSPPIQIRNANGDLIYNNLHLNLDKSEADSYCMWLFGHDGYYLRQVKFNQFYHRTGYFLDDEYYVILNTFPASTDYTDFMWIVDNLEIEWLNPSRNETVYYVGTGGDFADFTEMLTALEDDATYKTVYVYPGVYDIFAEVGGSERMYELAQTTSTLNWRDVCKVVPPNTKIIGIGDVTLKWDATAQDMQNADIAWLFSPLNISGSCEIENIKVVARNCRYAVHDEVANHNEFNGSVHHFKNCIFECLQSIYFCSIVYGSGHNKNMVVTFDNCEFINYQTYAWSTHNNNSGTLEASTYNFYSCIFRSSINNGYTIIRFGTDYRNGIKEKVKFNNCYIDGKLLFYTEWPSEVEQGYDVTLVGSSHVDIEYSANVTTRYDVRQYNSFS